MTNAKTEDKWQNAREQAQAQFESIRERVEVLEAAQAKETDDPEFKVTDAPREAIWNDALSVEVRSDWCVPGVFGDRATGAEYRILLCTGGPAVQITGKLSEHGEPETACLQMQDWFLPWTEYRVMRVSDRGETNFDHEAEEILLAYARQFYFGE